MTNYKLPRGTQILYVPNHAEGNLNHPDVQPGFVTSGPVNDDEDGYCAYFCRYWRYDHNAKKYIGELRTLANSELTLIANLVVKDTFPQDTVFQALEKYC